jgi:transposase-like protein
VTVKYTPEEKALAVELAEEGATMDDLIKRFGASRLTLRKWLDNAGVEPARKREVGLSAERGKRKKGQSLSNTPLALKLEENVRRRLEGRTDLLR